MPQLELITFINQYNWTIISFFSLLLVTGTYLIPKTNNELQTRKIITEAGSLNVKNIDEKMNTMKSIAFIIEGQQDLKATSAGNTKNIKPLSLNTGMGGNNYKLGYSTLLAQTHVA